jgi:biopolymer transport protein ExbD
MDDQQREEELTWPQPKPPRDARRKKKAIDIDMNPMVDLAFLLLTFFMLATTFSKPQVMELVMPVPPEKEDVEQVQPVKESQALTIVLSENDRVYWFRGIADPEVYRTDFSENGIRQVLRQVNNQVEGLVLLIKPEENSRYENLIDLLDEINQIGIERYAITELDEVDLAILGRSGLRP